MPVNDNKKGRLVELDSPDYPDYKEFVKVAVMSGLNDPSGLRDFFMGVRHAGRRDWPLDKMPTLEHWCRRHAAVNASLAGGLFPVLRAHVGACFREGAVASREMTAALHDRARYEAEQQEENRRIIREIDRAGDRDLAAGLRAACAELEESGDIDRALHALTAKLVELRPVVAISVQKGFPGR